MPMRDEASDYWLSEGFTDFYTFRLLVRDGIWSNEQYADAVNDVLRPMHRRRCAPHRNARA
jgi:predicted metalloprotease with PDZ domain